MVDGYAIALASLMLAAGTLGDRYGHRRVVIPATERRSEHPMLPLALFRRPRLSAANAIDLGTLGTLFVLTLYRGPLAA